MTAGAPIPQAPVVALPRLFAVELHLRGGRGLQFESTIDPAAVSALPPPRLRVLLARGRAKLDSAEGGSKFATAPPEDKIFTKVLK